MTKKILMIAGPNGAGKTTMAFELITYSSELYEFINADEIARSLSPKHPENVALAASKLMIKRLKELLETDKSFAFETTASGKNYLNYLKKAKLRGYELNLFFLWLASPSQAIKRVAQRVKHGGHHISKEVIVRRYYAGLKNLLVYYLPLADKAIIMNNSSEKSKGVIIARKSIGMAMEILDRANWGKIRELK